jgi:hypothetical protein
VTGKLSRRRLTFRAVMTFGTNPGGDAATPINFDLHAASHSLDATIEIHQVSGRWVSVAAARGQRVTAIGATARAAIAASLAWLGPAVASELLADLRLLDVSRQLRALTVG